MGDDGTARGAWEYDANAGTITVRWDTDDPNFAALQTMGNAGFDITFDAQFTGTERIIEFSDSVTVTFNDYHLANIRKEGSYDPVTGKITYTVTVSNAGVSENVKVWDELEGTILRYDGGSLSLSSTNPDHDLSGVTPTARASGGFEVDLGTMTDGEAITLTYTASVDYDSMAHLYSDGNYEHISYYVSTEEETANTAHVTADDQDELEASWHTESITSETLQKQSQWESIDDNHRRVTWNLTVNGDATQPVAGQTIFDTASSGGSPYASYDQSTPFTVTVKDRAGNVVETRTIDWANPPGNFTFTDTGSQDKWSYTVPSTDGEYRYEISYASIVDVSTLTSPLNLGNTLQIGRHSIGNNTRKPAGTAKFELSKSVDKAAASQGGRATPPAGRRNTPGGRSTSPSPRSTPAARSCTIWYPLSPITAASCTTIGTRTTAMAA